MFYICKILPINSITLILKSYFPSLENIENTLCEGDSNMLKTRICIFVRLWKFCRWIKHFLIWNIIRLHNYFFQHNAKFVAQIMPFYKKEWMIFYTAIMLVAKIISFDWNVSNYYRASISRWWNTILTLPSLLEIRLAIKVSIILNYSLNNWNSHVKRKDFLPSSKID